MDPVFPPTKAAGEDCRCANVKEHGQKKTPSGKAKHHIPGKRRIVGLTDGVNDRRQKNLRIKSLWTRYLVFSFNQIFQFLAGKKDATLDSTQWKFKCLCNFLVLVTQVMHFKGYTQ